MAMTLENFNCPSTCFLDKEYDSFVGYWGFASPPADNVLVEHRTMTIVDVAEQRTINCK